MMHKTSPTTMTGPDLRRWRAEHGMSQAQLAHALDVPKDTISRWERDALGIRHGRILALALQALNHSFVGASKRQEARAEESSTDAANAGQ
jgi:transcriptional regulator with XRE-family HTH domain